MSTESDARRAFQGSAPSGWKLRSTTELAGDLSRSHPHYVLDLAEPPRRGGMGAVYFGTDTRDGQHIALKLFPQDLAGEPGYLRRFLREIEILKQLRHEHIVPIRDDGETEDHGLFIWRGA